MVKDSFWWRIIGSIMFFGGNFGVYLLSPAEGKEVFHELLGLLPYITAFSIAFVGFLLLISGGFGESET